MNADEQVDILIRFIADTQGAQAAQAALQGLGGEINTLSPKTQQYIRDIKSGKIAAEEMEVSHRNLRAGLRMLGPEAAEAGHLMMMSFANPTTAAFIAVTLVVGTAINRLEEMKRALESGPSLANLEKAIKLIGVDGLGKALQDAEVEAAKFWQSLEPPNETSNAVNAQIAQIKARAEASKAELDAKAEQQNAVIDAQVKSGQLDKEAAESQKQTIKQRTEAGKASEDALAKRAEIETKANASKAAPSKEAVEASRQEAASIANNADIVQQKLDTLLAKRKEAQKFLDDNKKNLKFHPELEPEYIQAMNFLKSTELDVAPLRGEASSSRIAANDAAKRVADQEATVRQAQKYAQEAAADAALEKTRRAGAGKVAAIRGGTLAAVMSGVTGDSGALAGTFGNVIQGENAVAAGGNMSASQQKSTEAIMAFARQHGASQATITALFMSLKDAAVSNEQKYAELKAFVDQLNNRVHRMPNAPS